MLVIDSDMIKLSKMQEKLLRVTEVNRTENLNNYKRTVTEIDSEAFANILEELKHIGKHNQSLEEELQFLEDIKSSYDQLRELQLTFKSICELYGDFNLKLSDLSQLNIEYINNRISVINGYLVNLRNVEINKTRLQELNEQLVVESKKKDYLSAKLEQLESSLRDSFISAEGRRLVDGKLQYTSVIEEYKKIGIDFRLIIDDSDTLKRMLADIDKEMVDVSEKFRTAEICYNNVPNSESKQIFDEIRIDFLKVKYRLTMLKMLELLSFTYTDYDSFKEKREQILDLIKYRLSCLESLGEHVSIDPFARAKTHEQLDSLKSLPDNSKIINKIRKEISELTERTEEMINQNGDYLISLGDAKELLVSKISINDIDVSSVELSLDNGVELSDVDGSMVIEDNQVVDVRNTSSSLNMSIVRQKTRAVIKRVNQMMNDNSLDISYEPYVVEESPELVIVPGVFEKENNVPIFEDITEEVDSVFIEQEEAEDELDDSFDEEYEIDAPSETVDSEKESNIFETVIPFSEPIMFEGKTDGSLEYEQILSENLSEQELDEIAQKAEPDLELRYSSIEEMPDAFWVTEPTSAVIEENAEEEVLSFDDQINMLLDDQNGGKLRKLEVDRNIRKAA